MATVSDRLCKYGSNVYVWCKYLVMTKHLNTLLCSVSILLLQKRKEELLGSFL